MYKQKMNHKFIEKKDDQTDLLDSIIFVVVDRFPFLILQFESKHNSIRISRFLSKFIEFNKVN